MFWKKKPRQALYNEVDDSRAVVNDFQMRTPYESYRPADYRPYHKLEEVEMRPALESALEPLLAGSVDAGNGNMVDDLIFAVLREALVDLRLQQVRHGDTIQRLSVRRATDLEDIRRLRDRQALELDGLRREYEEICDKLKAAE